MNGVIITDYDHAMGDTGFRLYRDCFYCEICNDVVIYLGLDKSHSTLCQKCQDELSRGIGMSSKFRKMYVNHIAQRNSTRVKP